MSKNRFHGRKAILGMYSHAEIIRAKEIQLRYKPKHNKENYKTAVVVSKKVAKLAVVRNRIRRRIFEWIRLNIPEDYNYDIMITVFEAGLATTPPNQISTLLEKTFSKVKNPPAPREK